MQQFHIAIIGIMAILFACHAGNKHKEEHPVSNTHVIWHPVKPEGTVKVFITEKEKDTQQITIKFELQGLKKEKIFEQAVQKDIPEKDLYKIVWDAPNSCYIGVLKSNYQPRYYHAAVNKKEVEILWTAAPPEHIWQYMENTLGLGQLTIGSQLSGKYRKHIQSGKILGEFIAKIRPHVSANSLELFVEFGGLQKSMVMPVPADYHPAIYPTADADHILFCMVKDGKATPVVDLQVENGKLQVKKLKEIKN